MATSRPSPLVAEGSIGVESPPTRFEPVSGADDRTRLEMLRRLDVAKEQGDQRTQLDILRALNRGQLDAGDFRPADLDTTSGASFGARAGAAVKVTPAGRLNFVRAQLDEEAYEHPTLGIIYKDPKTGRPTLFDESGFSLRDMTADAAGAALETAPLLFSSANPMTAAGLAAGGSALRQGVSEALPGDDEISLAGRVGLAGSSALMGGAGQAVVNRGAAALDAVSPRNLTAGFLNKQMNAPIGKRAARLQREIGEPLTIGQATGSRAALTMEGLLRRHPMSADTVLRADMSQLAAAEKALSRVLDDLGKPLGAEGVGGRIETAFKGAVDAAVNARKSLSKADFAAVDAASRGGAIFDLRNTRAALDDLIQQFDVPGGGDATASLVGRLRSVRDELSGTIKPSQMQRLMQVYGSTARGSGRVFMDIDSAQQRMIAGRVMSALGRDLDGAVTNPLPGVSSDTAEALVRARSNWRAASQAIDELEGTTLGRMFNSSSPPAPERIAQTFLSMPPSQIRQSVAVLDKVDPSVMNDVRRFMLEDALQRSQSTGVNMPEAVGNIVKTSGAITSPRKFNSYMQRQGDRMLAAFRGNPDAIVQIKRINEYMSRLADRAGTDGSPTAPLMLAWDAAKGLFFSPATSGVLGAAMLIGPRHLAKAMTTEQGRRALLTVTRTSARTKARAEAMAFLGGVFARDAAAGPMLSGGSSASPAGEPPARQPTGTAQ